MLYPSHRCPQKPEGRCCGLRLTGEETQARGVSVGHPQLQGLVAADWELERRSAGLGDCSVLGTDSCPQSLASHFPWGRGWGSGSSTCAWQGPVAPPKGTCANGIRCEAGWRGRSSLGGAQGKPTHNSGEGPLCSWRGAWGSSGGTSRAGCHLPPPRLSEPRVASGSRRPASPLPVCSRPRSRPGTQGCPG